VPELGEHSANLSLLALGQNQLELGGMALTAHDPGPLGADLAVGQPDALGQLGKRIRAGQAGHECAIKLLHSEPGVRKPVGQVAVVGQDHETSAIFVQTADSVDALGKLGEEVDNPRTACGVEIGRDISLGFVDGVIHDRLEADRLAVDCDPRLRGVYPSAELPDSLAIDGDPPLEDELLA
jgi:hypothetical protein